MANSIAKYMYKNKYFLHYIKNLNVLSRQLYIKINIQIPSLLKIFRNGKIISS